MESVAYMHRMYKEWMDVHRKEKTKVSLRQYQDEFSKLKIKIFQPRKDQCDTLLYVCFAYKNLPEERQNVPDVQYALENHIMFKDLAEALYKQDKALYLKNPTTIVASYDLEKVLQVPHCLAGEAYYKRKLNVLNFTIKEYRTAQGYCYVWDEATAKRGANEIATCLEDYISIRSKDGVMVFIFWSDNCGPPKTKIDF